MQFVSLNGDWKFKSESDEKWIRAKVPGDVHLDLSENKVIEDPLYANNAEKCRWIEEKIWIYKRNFFVPEGFKKDRVELIFKGLDLDAEILLNGTKIKEHHNAFVPCIVNVTERIKEGDNELIVKLDVGKKRVKDKPVKKYYANENRKRIWMRKSAFAFGQDFVPYLPTCGIWRDVELRSYESVAIRDVFLHSHIEENKAVLDIDIETENFTPEIMNVDLVLSLREEKEYNLKKTLTLSSGLNKISYKLEVPNPKLWYPQPIGEPYLYNFTLTIYENNKELDSYFTKYGIREIELIQEPIEEGKSFIVSINKKKVFCKGANWVPADFIPANVSKEKYKKLIELASKANFNMFRINGGGIYEDPLFYQLCDEYGIMIWQDFMFDGPYPDDDPEFMQEVEREARTIIRELRNHPSLVLWCGNNESQWMHYKGAWGGRKARLYGSVIYDELLPKICKTLDPTRPYWPSSPYGGENFNCEEEGNRHAWQVSLLAKDPYKRVNYKCYAVDKGKFITEFGYLSPPVKESLLEFTPQEELYINSPTWKYHNNFLENGNIMKTALERLFPDQEKLSSEKYGNMMKTALERFFIPQEKLSLEEYIVSSQMLQAEALKFALEHWRRRMFDTAGALFWMFSDCWGTTGGWPIVDYYLRLKPSYFYVKRAFEPVHISLKEASSIEVWITNDTYNTYPVDIEYGIKTFDGEELIKEYKQEKLPVGRARIIDKINTTGISQKQRSRVFCYAKVYSKNKLISQNRYFLVDFKNLEIPKPKLKTVLKKLSESAYKLKLSSENFVWMVNIQLPGGILVNDDYFDIFPGENYEVTITTSKTIGIGDIGISTMNQVIRKYKK